jgi:hypothetical protein
MENKTEVNNIIINSNNLLTKKTAKVKKPINLFIEGEDVEVEEISSILPKKEDNEKPNSHTNIINKGTGAGGAYTNINGLSYEEKTNLEQLFSEVNIDNKSGTKTIKFINNEHEFVNAKKTELYKYLESRKERNLLLQPAAGCKQPDEAYIDLNRKIIFIIEKKFQQTPGSVDEKIQTGPFKKIHYSKQFPNYKVNYIYCLSDWFKRDEYKSVLDYLQENSIPVFWGNDIEYKNDIINFMCL